MSAINPDLRSQEFHVIKTYFEIIHGATNGLTKPSLWEVVGLHITDISDAITNLSYTLFLFTTLTRKDSDFKQIKNITGTY